MVLTVGTFFLLFDQNLEKAQATASIWNQCYAIVKLWLRKKLILSVLTPEPFTLAL
jgi:hypothetical protein